MEETKRRYESMVMISCKCGGDGIDAIVGKLKKLIEDEESAELVSCDEWGKKKLAYPVNKEIEAYYVLFNFISDSKFPAEFSRICGITDGILRSMIVKLVEKKKKAPKRAPKRARAESTESPEKSENSATSEADADLEKTEKKLETSENSVPSDVSEDMPEEV